MEAKQNLLFDFPKLEIKNKIRLIELFGGIGSQAMALRDIGADFEHYRLVEFDKYAVTSYNAIHGTDFKTSDIRDIHGADLGIVDKDKFTYLLTYSFPCTDLSLAGKMKGMSKVDWENGNSTRSGLLWEVERILKELPEEQLPQVLLMENVPQVHAEANLVDFESWLAFLRSKGYVNHWADLNAKDYGIPQNRVRCFCVSILSPDYVDYEFPSPHPLSKVMRDFLEASVNEKYYIDNERTQTLITQLVEDSALPTEQTVESFLCFEIKQATKGGTIKCKVGGCFDTSYPNSKTRRGRVQEEGNVTPAITAGGTGSIAVIETRYRLRKLTPRECWRLMGYTDEDFEKAQGAGVSNTQLYKQAGNAIVKQVLMGIFLQMIRAESREQRAESREQRAESREQRACSESADVSITPVYANYKRIEKVDVPIAKTLMARDSKGFNTGFDVQNGVLEMSITSHNGL